ncbi:MAG: PRC-barrel domain-containing protein [Granulosicoccus sp.]|nr:PRC-barrel domain-containing protein [Granulosicoccus sp.]
MKHILASSLIAMSVSAGALAQQAADEVETSVKNAAQSVENTVEKAAAETELAAENAAQEVDAMGEKIVADRPMLRSPTNIVRDGYMPLEPADLTTEDLTGARVYGANDEDIGEIDELLLSEDGKSIDRVIVDVGGFLGMGEHEVAVTMEELHIMRSDDGSDFRVYMDATEEELEAQPEYEG